MLAPVRRQNVERLPRLGHVSDTERKFADALARMSRSEDHRKKRPDRFSDKEPSPRGFASYVR
jgi:hypothetical protein